MFTIEQKKVFNELLSLIKSGEPVKWIPKRITKEKGDPNLRDLFIGNLKISRSETIYDPSTMWEEIFGSGTQTTLPDDIIMISPDRKMNYMKIEEDKKDAV